MESKWENTINNGPSTSQGSTQHIPICRGGYLSSDEEADCQADTNNAALMLKDVELDKNTETGQDVKSHGDAPFWSDKSETEKFNYLQFKRQMYPSELTTAGPVKMINPDPKLFTQNISNAAVNLNEIASEEPKNRNSDESNEPAARTSTLERIAKKVTKHFKVKAVMPYNLRSRANFQKTSKQIKKSAKAVVTKGRFMFKGQSKFVPQFFKKN